MVVGVARLGGWRVSLGFVRCVLLIAWREGGRLGGGLGLRAGETTLVHTVCCCFSSSSSCSRDKVLQALL